jgi:hypothetical protein
MDTTVVLVIIVLALVAIAAFVVFQHRAKVNLTGPFGTSLSVDGSNDPKPAVKISNADAGRDIKATDKTGRGAEIDQAKARGSITATSTPPRSDPKV